MNVRASCTSKLQTFHQTKPFKGSPLKAGVLKMSNKYSPASVSCNTAYDPRPEHLRNRTEYSADFRSACVNFASSGASMPIIQLCAPANPFAIAKDHDYLKDTPEDNFLKTIHVTAIESTDIKHIEEQTRGQSNNPTWFNERSVRLQSSQFWRICKATSKTDFPGLAASLTQVSKIKTKTLEHGIKYESVAIKKYEEITTRNTTKCGIFVCAEKPFSAASTDKVVNDNLLLEVKCPFTAIHGELCAIFRVDC